MSKKNYTCTQKHDGKKICGGPVYECDRCERDYCVYSGMEYHGLGKCCPKQR